MEINYLSSNTIRKIQGNISGFFRYRERMISLVERLKYLVSRQEEAKKSIKEKVNNIKSAHKEIMELEPKLRNSFTRMRKIEIVVFELEDRINRKEDEIRCKKNFLGKYLLECHKEDSRKMSVKVVLVSFLSNPNKFFFS